jgi:hypothetical protein
MQGFRCWGASGSREPLRGWHEPLEPLRFWPQATVVYHCFGGASLAFESEPLRGATLERPGMCISLCFCVHRPENRIQFDIARVEISVHQIIICFATDSSAPFAICGIHFHCSFFFKFYLLLSNIPILIPDRQLCKHVPSVISERHVLLTNPVSRRCKSRPV